MTSHGKADRAALARIVAGVGAEFGIALTGAEPGEAASVFSLAAAVKAALETSAARAV